MKQRFTVAGITFRARESEEFRNLIPVPLKSEVRLEHSPYINEEKPEYSDPMAVKVFVDDVFVGYMPKGSVARDGFFAMQEEMVDIDAVLTDVSYAKYNTDYNIIDESFCDDPSVGYIGSLTIEIDLKVDSYSYHIGGQRFLRASSVAGMIDTVGFKVPKFLYNWMTSADINGVPQNTYNEYEAKLQLTVDAGNRIHALAEEYAKTGIATESTPIGVINFFSDYQVRTLSCEQMIRAGRKYRVAGRYDLLATARADNRDIKVIIDWKNSKTVKFAHVVKGAFYAHYTKAEEVWIVLLGTKNKCGYSLKRYKKDETEKLYGIFKSLTKVAYDMIGLGFGKMFGVKNERRKKGNNSRKLSV